MAIDRYISQQAGEPFNLDDLIASHEPFILKCAAKASGRFIQKSDDEWSYALEGFAKALARFDAARGPFFPFAELVIRRTLTDYYREQKRRTQGEILEEEIEEIAANPDQEEIRLEIQALQETLREYGISFDDLAGCSPRTPKTRNACAKAVRAILADGEIAREMRQSFHLPAGAVSKATGISRKLLDRHRKYLIAVAEILDGEYLYLAEYVKYIKEVE